MREPLELVGGKSVTEQLEGMAHALVDSGPATGCLFIVATDDDTTTVPRVSPRADGFKVARLMLAAHLDHLQATMDRMGVERDLEDVARQAVEDYRDLQRESDNV